MLTTASAGPHHGTVSLRAALVVSVLLTLFGAVAPQARATFRVSNHNDPAGDPTVIAYHEGDPRGPSDFRLGDGQSMSFGPFEGVATAQAVLPPGWHVVDIQCVGPDPSAFVIDRQAGTVTAMHHAADEQFCSFTNSRTSAAAAVAAGPAPAGIAPSPPVALLPKVQLSRAAAMLGVTSKRRVATATIRITRRSAITGRLLLGRRVVGTARIVKNAGSYDLGVRLAARTARRLSVAGRRRVTLTLRIVVRPLSGGATQVFAPRVILRL
jgi:hypothetical protein